MSACKDGHIRVYDTGPSFSLKRDVSALDYQWSILDTDISPDRTRLIYSSWSHNGVYPISEKRKKVCGIPDR